MALTVQQLNHLTQKDARLGEAIRAIVAYVNLLEARIKALEGKK